MPLENGLGGGLPCGMPWVGLENALTLHLGNALVSALGECPGVGMPWGMPLVRRGNALDFALGECPGACPWGMPLGVGCIGGCTWWGLGMPLARSLMSARACTLESAFEFKVLRVYVLNFG